MSNLNLLQNWSSADFKNVEKQLTKFLKSRYFETHHSGIGKTPFIGCKTFRQYADVLGLAYTSSSSFACYNICNTSLYFDVHHKWKIEFIACDKQGFVYLIMWDNEENEIVFNIN